MTSFARNTKRAIELFLTDKASHCPDRCQQYLSVQHAERRLLQDAFFIGRQLATTPLKVLLLFVLLAGTTWADECRLQLTTSSASNTQQVAVKKVIDGDTIRLYDNRLVRFIGINTPEIDHKFGNSQPLAERGRDFLQTIIAKQQGKIQIQFDVERHDRHGRLLAHLFTLDGSNIQAEMIRQGLGVWIVVPPNLQYMDCYRAKERIARQNKAGVWGVQFQSPRDIQSLTKQDRGFQWIRGRIVHIGKGKKYLWLNFADDALFASESKNKKLRSRVTLRVRKDDLHYFNEYPVDSFINKTVTVRGWLSQYKNQLVMSLRHPASIEFVNQSIEASEREK